MYGIYLKQDPTVGNSRVVYDDDFIGMAANRLD